MHLLILALIGLLGLAADSVARADNSLVSVYQKACDAGDAFYCQALGVALANGKGTPVDKARAAAAFIKACDDDAVVACRYAGDLYMAGDGVKKDTARATTLYRRACDHHDAEACNKIKLAGVPSASPMPSGSRTMAQHGAPDKTPPSATDFSATERQVKLGVLKRNCLGGDGKSCRLLADALDSGRGWNRTSLQQATLYEKACVLKDGSGCYQIGQLYKNGYGVLKDDARAQAAFKQGCAYGNKGSCLMLHERP